MVRIHGFQVFWLLSLLAVSALPQEGGFGGLEVLRDVQEPFDLSNSSLLPLAGPPLQLRLAQLDRWIADRQWEPAARLLQDLVREGLIDLVRHDRRSATGFLEHLAAKVAHPELRDELEQLDRAEWDRLWRPGLADEERLASLLEFFPFRAEVAEALLNLADLYLEAGRPQDALAVLGRYRLLPEAGRRPEFLEALEKRRKLAISMGRGNEPKEPMTPVGPGDLMLKVVEGGPQPQRQRWPERGILEGRASMALLAGQLWLHDGKRLWRVGLDPLEVLGPPIEFAFFLGLEGREWIDSMLLTRQEPGPLPRCMAAEGDRLALVAGERPEPGDRPGRHGLFCLEIAAGKEPPVVLWRHRGRIEGVLPVGLAPEDQQVLARGPLSFGAGPVWVDQDLLVTIHAPMDRTRVTAFLARLDGRSGQPRWIRFLAQGAPEALDPLFDRLSALPFPELTGAPLLLQGGSVFVATDLGTVHALEAWSGRPLWAVQTARSRPESGRESGFLRSTLALEGDLMVGGLKDSDWVYIFRAWPFPGEAPLAAPPLPRRRLTWLIGLQGRHAYFTASDREESTLVRLSLPEGEWRESVPLLSGDKFLGVPLLHGGFIYFCTERYLFRADLGRDLFLEDPLQEMREKGPRLLGPLVPWRGALASIGEDGVGLWRP